MAAPSPISVLVADDSPDILAMFRTLLDREGYAVDTAGSGDQALALLDDHVYDLVVSDLKMGGPDGLAVLARVKAVSPGTTVVMMTGYASLETALTAIRGGAYDYLTKPFTLDEIEVMLANVTDRIRGRRERALLERELEDAYRLITRLQQHVEEAVNGPRPGAAPVADAEPADPGSASPRRVEALAAYEAAAWSPERARERLATLLRDGALSPDAYQRLSDLVPRGPTVA
jgi:CheY-like chemotaxis protein